MIFSTLSIFASIQTRSKVRVNDSAEFELWNLKLSFGLSIFSFILYNLRHPFDKYHYLLRKFSPLQKIDALITATFKFNVNYPFEYRFFVHETPRRCPNKTSQRFDHPYPRHRLEAIKAVVNFFVTVYLNFVALWFTSLNKKECAKILCAFPLHRKRPVSFRPQAFVYFSTIPFYHNGQSLASLIRYHSSLI